MAAPRKKKASVDEITVDELIVSPVWRVTTNPKSGDVELISKGKGPFKDLRRCIVGVEVTLADGSRIWSIIGNVKSTNLRLTEQFLTISVNRNGEWFHLARYFDFDYNKRNPQKLCKFLSKKADEVFPIQYDLREYSRGDADVLSGVIPLEPKERLTDSEIIMLAVPKPNE